MPPRKKKKEVVVPQAPVVQKIEPPKRIIPSIPNTIHFYVYNQNLIRMESLDKTLNIAAVYTKEILKLVKNNKLEGTYLYTLVKLSEETFNVEPPVLLEGEAIDDDLKKQIDKLTIPSTNIDT